MIRRPPRSTLFPYTTLFRSDLPQKKEFKRCRNVRTRLFENLGGVAGETSGYIHPSIEIPRSEEHTSELQSRLHLVCRLLLEKKNNTEPAPERTSVSTMKSIA